jgi:1-deoxy-D-xylulose-5-phosphate reductoisomerase
MTRTVTILGSTGSVGVSTLDFLERAGVEAEMLALAAGRNVARLAEQALRWRPHRAVIEDESLLPELRSALAGTGIEAVGGSAAVVEAAAMGADFVMSAIVGAAGLAPTLAAARAGSVIGLANKESLVCAGPTLLAIARAAGGRVIPVDSEHSAIFQVFEADNAREVSRLILTASGGPFRAWTLEAMRAATRAQALKHPNWSMGDKITIDSATMMNKGLEMIEAAYLFGMPPEKVDVIVHPQSVVHSLVEYADGSTLAQLGMPDMRTPIACAWAHPGRAAWDAPRLDLAMVGTLTFEAPDEVRFPALRLAREALGEGAGAPAAMNAANEVAVRAFLDDKIGFLDITDVTRATVETLNSVGALEAGNPDETVDWAMMIDASARRTAEGLLPRWVRQEA